MYQTRTGLLTVDAKKEKRRFLTFLYLKTLNKFYFFEAVLFIGFNYRIYLYQTDATDSVNCIS
jgi:hypothetical protein